MSSYLEIAEKVLRSERRPMSAKAILKRAYSANIAPHHLYGKTQHKTLQARLSEDILQRRERSPFFRTKPGLFFLREFLTDTSIPIENRQPIVARRRTRDLFLGPALALGRGEIGDLLQKTERPILEAIQKLAKSDNYRYVDPKNLEEDDVLIWSVAAVVKPGKILSYRVGRYRDDRESFANKRSVNFSTLVSEKNRTLFDNGSLGISDSALFAISSDLDIPLSEALSPNSSFEQTIRFFALHIGTSHHASLLAFVEINAPDWFEPTGSRLSLNDLKWLDLCARPNNWDDFDPWSQDILSHYFSTEARKID